MTREGFTIPVYEFPEAAAQALSRVADYAEWRATPYGEVPIFSDIDVALGASVVEAALERLGSEGGWLEPDETDQVLRAFGLRTPQTRIARSEREAYDAAVEIGKSVALKVISPSALHKSDVGGVALDVLPDEVAEAYGKVFGAVDDAEGVLVQEMVTGGHEVLIGMTEDPSFGPLLVFGLGGIYVELLGDVSFRVAPITDSEAATMVRDIKASKLLEGYRGLPPGDIAGTQEALLRVSAMVEAIPEFAEMDLNPVKVLAPGEGVVVVDARIRVVPVRQGWAPDLVDIPSVASR